MARVKFSALVSEMRNKLNGSVFSKNRAGNYLRNKVTPVNPRSVSQVAFRQTFGMVSSAYRGLSSNNVKTWIDGSAAFPYTDIFGDTKFLSASQLHQKLNTNLASINIPLLSVCPIPEPLSDIVFQSAVFDLTAQTLTITATAGNPSIDSTWILEATPGVSNSVNFVKNKYRRISFTASTVSPPVASAQFFAYTYKFGTPKVGQKIYIRLSIINNRTGQSTQGVVVVASIVP